MVNKRKWVTHLAVSNIKKHMRRNVFSILSLIVGLTASFLIIGFSSNANTAIEKECYKQFDYGSLTISKEIKTESKNGGLSIVRNNRPSLLEMKSMENKLSNYEIDLNFDSLISNYPRISYDSNELKDYSYESIYSFTSDFINPNLLLEGELPASDSLYEVVINKEALKQFKTVFKETILGKTLKIYQENESVYYTDNDLNPVITDYFIFDKEVKVVGVVDDLNFLATPKIYYSYLALKDYLSVVYLNNLSQYLNKDVSWVNRVDEANGAESISSYSYRLFLKDYSSINTIENDVMNYPSPFVITCPSLTRSNALLDLIGAATTGMEVFLIIALIGTSLIMGIVSFSFYSEDKKTIAILLCLGGKMGDVNDIYCTENIIIAVTSFLVSISLAPLLQLLVNWIIKLSIGFEGVIKIPFLKFLNIPFGLPLIVFVSTILIAVLSTLLPILFSKKISLKEELKDE